MNINLDKDEIELIKKASAKADTWHFNKILIALMIIFGLAIVVGKLIYDINTIGIVGQPIFKVVFSLMMFGFALTWLKVNWGKTDNEKVIDTLYCKIKESA